MCPEEKRPSRRWLWTLIRIAVTALAVFWVVRTVHWKDRVQLLGGEAREVNDLSRQGDRVALVWPDGSVTEHPAADVTAVQKGVLSLLRRVDKPLFLLLTAGLLGSAFLMALRWWLLLRGSGFTPPLRRTFFVTYAGMFFNNFLPGSVGGDLTKALIATSGESRKAAMVGTVILDRLVGLGVMIVMGAACLVPFVSRLEDRRLAYVVFGLVGGMGLAYVLYFNRTLRNLLRNRLPFQKTLRELDGVFRLGREQKRLVGVAAVLSLAGQAASILIIYGLSRALGMGGVGLWAFFVFEPIIFIVSALPISVGGWGVQEGVYAYMFGTFAGADRDQAIALSILYKVSMILVSTPGGLLFLLGAAKKGGSGR